jgi:hypothetical protein
MTVSVTKYSDMKKKAGKILIALFLFILPATALYAQMPDQIIIGLSSGNAKRWQLTLTIMLSLLY